MAAYCTGSDPIEIGDFGSEGKVTATIKVSKYDEKIFVKNSTVNIFLNLKPFIWKHIAVILIPNMTILYNKYSKKLGIKKIKSASD